MTTSKHEAYEWALFGAMLWSQDARDGVLPTDFQSAPVQALARELIDIYAGKIKPEAAHWIRDWLRASRINVDTENRSSAALKKIVKQLSALSRARTIANGISNGLARNALGLPNSTQSEIKRLAEELVQTLNDGGDGPTGTGPLD